MAESPEIPEAKDPFEKRAAVTIAILAVSLAVIGNKGDDSKTEAIIKTNEAANGYSYYQAKGIKGSIASAQEEMLTLLAASPNAAGEIPEKIKKLKADAERYKEEQVDIKKEADKDKDEAKHESAINNRCDHAELALQVGIIAASVSILARSHAFWIGSIILGLIGVAIGVTAFLI
jgi:hypothetical protein